MTLTDDFKEAEQQAREAVLECVLNYTEAFYIGHIVRDVRWADKYRAVESALSRHAAVCRLAGRWEQIANAYVGSVVDVEARICAELAQLMEGCG